MPLPGIRATPGGARDDPAIEMKRTPCVICRRKFPEDRLKVHEEICKSIKKKRPVYNSTAHRLEGVATDQEIKRIMKEKTKPTELDILLRFHDYPEPKYMRWTAKIPPDNDNPLLSNIPWRESNVSWSGKDRPSTNKRAPDGRYICPGCNRRFAQDVAEKHIPGCVARHKR